VFQLKIIDTDMLKEIIAIQRAIGILKVLKVKLNDFKEVFKIIIQALNEVVWLSDIWFCVWS